MSRFDPNIELAQARQRRIFTFIALGGITVVTMLAVLWVFTRGTAVEILPQEANSRAELRVKKGLGFIIGRSVYTFGETVVEASASGFVTEEIVVTVEKQSGFIEVVMREAPAMLYFTTSPEDSITRWFIDTVPVAVAKNLSMPTKAGRYVLTIDNPYYQKATMEIEVKKGEEFRRNVSLLPVQGYLEVTTVPLGGTVFLDGKSQGVAPDVYNVAGGRHTLSIHHPGYKEIKDTIYITNSDTNISRNYNLLPQHAFVRFQLQPPGGKLLLNGRQVDETGRVRVNALHQYTASYLKAGYFPQTKAFTLNPGDEDEIQFLLEEEIGVVEIMSVPKAIVMIDGKKAGITPMTAKLPAVEHEITLVKDGYRSVTRRLTPSSQHNKGINVTLVTELHARMAENPTTYKNSIGITMRLFKKPGSIEMGAPRHEKGQRANEFQRKVQLTKAFYVAVHETTELQFNHYKNVTVAKKPDIPVTNVSWLDAAGFCNWLSVKEGLKSFYILKNGRYLGTDIYADGYRLLTEAEWEWLARKAGRTKQTRFTWGDNPEIRAPAGNLADQSTRGALTLYISGYTDSFARLAPVGSFAADKIGLYDLSGNVSEWVHDVYSLVPFTNPNDVEVDPMGPTNGSSHVLKGSNWRSATLTELRASFRETATEGRDDLGFRIARYLYGGEDAINQ